jgi:HEAT repeat protein
MKSRFTAVVAAAAALAASQLPAQSISDRVNSVRDGIVRFSFASREAVCGNSSGMLSVGGSNYVIMSGMNTGDSCERGPVHVVFTRARGLTTFVETFAGPRDPAVPNARDLGRVGARDASQYLFAMAANGEGRPARDALVPAVLADSAEIFTPLLALIRDANRPREIRSSAISWLGRAGGELNAAPRQQVVDALLGIARDPATMRTIRDQSVSAVSRLPRAEGVAPLIELSRNASDPSLARYALSTISSSGDPRVRTLLRDLAQQNNAPDSMRVIAIQGLGRSYASSQDIATLRSLYASYTNASARSAIITAVADFGGSENASWLLARGTDAAEDVARRRSALQGASRAGVAIAELVSAYDRAGDRTTREELINLYFTRGERAGIDKLIAIARSDTDMTLRRSAITRLSRSDDPRVIAVLREIVIPRGY